MKRFKLLLSLCCGLFLYGCSLDYENTGAIVPDAVWKDAKMINAYLANIYGNIMPGWNNNSSNGTDEGMGGIMSQYVRGEYSVLSDGQGLNYANIDRINFLLGHLAEVGTDVLSQEENGRIRGQALFWRAWDYWNKVLILGGVPLVLKEQDVLDMESLLLPRNSTSECVTQIVKDLDEAISLLPDTWDDVNYGRIDKGCAMAFKGRVLMQYASPLFNPNHDQGRWEAAYKANKEAIDFLQGIGKGLYQGDFANIWYDEQNCEVVMVNQYYEPDHRLDQKDIRPLPLSRDGSDHNVAILPLLLAFPKADGTPLVCDVNRLATDEAYNQQFVNDFYINRDPRFHATVFCPGTEYPCDDVLTGGMKYWNARRVYGDTFSDLIYDELGVGGGPGFYQRKGLDYKINKARVYEADIDWIEIRFAEVLMNYGECANEIGKAGEALQVLYDIRKRVGIQSTDGKYGITASSQDEIREAYINERFIEFAYENKRWTDLRRWKRFDILNKMQYRSTLWLVIKDYSIVENGNFDWTKDMFDPEVRKLFRFYYEECLDGDKSLYRFNLDDKHWFYPIKRDDLDRNSKLEQNNEWDGGTFDPLK